ncbi:MAG: hypothetical protein ACFFD4_33755 [Candidatus Odinarchaeota archaeon]
MKELEICAFSGLIFLLFQLLHMLNIIHSVNFILSIIYSALISSGLVFGKQYVYRILPFHFRSGKVLYSSITTSATDSNGFARFYLVKQVPAKMLKSFLLALGTQNYSIMEQSTRTILVMYTDSSKNDEGLRVKESLVSIIPDLVLEEIGFEQVLSIQTADQTNEILPFVRQITEEPEKINTANEPKKDIISSSTGQEIHLCNTLAVLFGQNLLEPLVSAVNSNTSNLVTGAFMGFKTGNLPKYHIKSYFLFDKQNFEGIKFRSAELERKIKEKRIKTKKGIGAGIVAYFVGFSGTRNEILTDLKKILVDYQKSAEKDIPLIVLKADSVTLESFIPSLSPGIRNETMLHHALQRLNLIMVK